ncbi:MAG: STAS domain-containing protein, partial [Gammaproteobacteria bacterium]|nr:STAS domain-containing protein [Gammaproteobacteria bacterium]NIW44527.1 STAS domain-containing protein [Gammaproteobacteria bacterium]NIX55651.1 STAS domain-containing protein [candidate division Zixibacteria bacterium]
MAQTRAKAVLIDISSLDIVDSFVARVISETSEMVRIMDTNVVVVGMQPAVTMTLVDMGMKMSGIETAIDMDSGLQ